MKNNRITAVMLSLAVTAASTLNVFAMDITNISVSDPSKGIITVEGNLGEGKNNRDVIMYLTKTEDGSQFAENVVYFDSVAVGKDGLFEFDFKLNALTDNYLVNVKYEDELSSNAIAFVNPEDLKEYIIQLCDAQIDDIAGTMEKYQDMFGVKASVFASSANAAVLKKRIADNSSSIKAKVLNNDFALAVETIRNASDEVTALKNISEATLWSEVDTVIGSNAAVLGIDSDKHSKLSNSVRQSVCASLAGRTFAEAESFSAEYGRLVQSYSSSGTGGSGKTTGGGGKTTGSVAAIIPESSGGSFDDISSVPWAADAINGLVKRSVLSGVGNNKFEPNREVKREEVVKMIVMAFSLQDNGAAVSFGDVSSDEWYYTYIRRGVGAGIINGVSADEFGVGRAVTRQELAALLYRTANYFGMTFAQERNFADDAQIADYAKDAVSALAGSGIIDGVDGSNFAPEQSATRAQTAKLIWKLLQIKEGV